jgi:transposase
MLTHLFFPRTRGLRVTGAYREGLRIHLEVVPTRRTASCPVCHARSRRVHSRYRRTLDDLPCAGDPLTVHMTARRFVCRRAPCPRRIFTERVPQLTWPHARKTTRLLSQLQQDGIALGGNPGARRAAAEGKPVSARTLLRLVRALPLPEVGAMPVIGVDDWARRRGRSYGTLIVDLTQHRIVDLLPDRTADTLVTWLVGHPEVEIAARDRAGAYAEGLRRGAPTAVQVADRFHIGTNLVAAVERALHRYRGALRLTAEQLVAATLPPTALPAPGDPDGSEEGALSGPPPPLTSDPQGSRARRERRHARDTEVLALHQQGLSRTAIAARLHLTRSTVRTILRAGEDGVRLGRSLPPSVLRPFEPYLWERWQQGCHNARVLYDEVARQGYHGSAINLRRALRSWRPRSGHQDRQDTSQPADARRAARAALQVVTPRHAAWLLVGDVEQHTADERAFLTQLLITAPDLGELRERACAFLELLRHRDAAALSTWLAAAVTSPFPELHGFALGVQRDRAAVTAGLTWAWSNGQTEGQVNRLKVLRRSMYGRGKDDLLQRRLVLASQAPRRIKSA